MRHYLKAFFLDERGATAVEFAFIALPLFALLIGIVQLALILFAGSVLDSAVKSAARFVVTGQAQSSTWAPSLQAKKDRFRQELCKVASVIMDCSKISFEVRVMPGFSSSSPAIPFKADGTVDDSRLGFDLGNAEQIVFVRATYLFPVFADILGSGLINAGTNKRLIVGSAIFVNEPF